MVQVADRTCCQKDSDVRRTLFLSSLAPALVLVVYNLPADDDRKKTGCGEDGRAHCIRTHLCQ